MTKTISRKSILSAILADEDIMNALVSHFDFEDSRKCLTDALNKWDNALNKTNKSADKAAKERDEFIVKTIVPFVVEHEGPVTAKQVNDAVVHAEKTNKASAMLRRAVEMELVSRDKVRKNANFEYAAMDFDWDTYISDYDAKMTAKAQARIAKAHKNRAQ